MRLRLIGLSVPLNAIMLFAKTRQKPIVKSGSIFFVGLNHLLLGGYQAASEARSLRPTVVGSQKITPLTMIRVIFCRTRVVRPALRPRDRAFDDRS